MTTKIINLKSFREETNKYLPQIEKGVSFVVLRRSKPVFIINPIDEDTEWETIIDFTKIKKGGVPIQDILSRLK